MGPHALGEATRPADDRVLAVRAEVLVAAQAVRTTHAAAGKPAKPDAVAYFDFFHLVARGDDAARNFVARDQRESGVAPVVVDDRQIRVANAAVIDRDFDLLVTERTRIKFEGFKGGSG